MGDSDIELRVSDAERSDTLRHLVDCLAAGRLDLGEFETRTDRALAAVTSSDLTAVTVDLPTDQRAVDRRDRTELLLEWRWWLAGLVVLNGVWLVQFLAGDDTPHYWPAVPLAIWGLILVGAVIAPRTSERD